MTSRTEAAKAAEHQTVLSFDERERILCQFISEPINHDREMAIAIEAATQERLLAPLEDYERVVADHRRLVRELDVLLNGDGAAAQASLCDIVAQVKRDGIKASARVADTSAIIRDVCELDPADEGPDTVSVTVAELTRIIERHSAPVAGEAREHYDEVKATLQGAHRIMESLSAIERRVGPVGSHARGYTHKITNALLHLDALYAAPRASETAVRNEALHLLREARALLPAFTTAEAIGAWSEKVRRFEAGEVIDVPPQAGKDGGQQRAMDSEELRRRVLSAIHDAADMKPEDEETWEEWYCAAFDLLGSRVGDIFRAALSPTQTEQGERDE